MDEGKIIKLEKHDRYFIELNVRDRVELVKGDGTCSDCIYEKEKVTDEKDARKDIICEGVAHLCGLGVKGHFIKDTYDKDCRIPLKVTSICGLY